MYDQSNLDERVGQLDDTVERLTSEVSALKLELATLVSALRDIQSQHSTLRAPVRPQPRQPEPPSRPSLAPAAIVVLLATSLLSWQLIFGSRPDRLPGDQRNAIVETVRAETTRPVGPTAPAIELQAEEPPITPLVKPTIYKGTLTVNADAPGATVFVNRQNVGTAPVRVRNLKAGAHLVWVERDGYRRWTRVVTVPAERVTRVAADLQPLEPVIEN